MDVREGEVHKPEEVAAPPVTGVRKRKSVVREYAEAIAIAILLALVIRTLIVQAFTIPSGSMMDTLLVGDYILVNKFLYGPELPVTDYRGCATPCAATSSSSSILRTRSGTSSSGSSAPRATPCRCAATRSS